MSLEPLISIAQLRLFISGLNPVEIDEGLMYELMAESCIPGIFTKDYKMIFEEQTNLKNLQMVEDNVDIMNYSTFFEDENTFDFGTLIVSKSVNGLQERIKIVNSNKIPCKVNLKIINNDKEAVFSSDVTQLMINAHEFA